MREFLRKIFSFRSEEVEPENAAEFYREEKSDEIEAANRRAQQLMDETRQVVEEVDEALEELKDYDDEKDLQVVEDVADNFYRSRKKMIERLDLPDNIEEHASEFEEFSEQFNDVSRKEGEVLKHIDKGDGDLPGAIQGLSGHVEKLQDFLEEDYSVVRMHEELEEKVEELEEKQARLEGIDPESGEVEELEKKLEDKRQEIQELEESDEWEEKQLMQRNIEELEEDREEIRSELSRHVSKIDRSLKKILYQVENGDVEFKADVEKLRKLESHDFDELDEVEHAVKEARRIIRERDIVDESQERKFEEAASELSELDERKKEISRIEDGIDDLEQQLQDLDVDERMQELEKERQRIEAELEEAEQGREEREEEVDRLEDEVEQLRKQVIHELDSALKIDVRLQEQG